MAGRDGNRVHGKAEVIIGKQRHGPTGTVELQFDGAVTRFDNLRSDDRRAAGSLCCNDRLRPLSAGGTPSRYDRTAAPVISAA